MGLLRCPIKPYCEGYTIICDWNDEDLSKYGFECPLSPGYIKKQKELEDEIAKNPSYIWASLSEERHEETYILCFPEDLVEKPELFSRPVSYM